MSGRESKGFDSVREAKMLEANKVVDSCIADLEKYRVSLQEQFDRILRKSGVDNPLRIEDIPIVKTEEIGISSSIMTANSSAFAKENKHKITIHMPVVIDIPLDTIFKDFFLKTYVHELCHVLSL